MNYKAYILNRFIDKYEHSKDYLNNKTDGHVLLRMDQMPEVKEAYESVSEKAELFRELKELEANRLINIVWYKYEENNLIDKLYLTDINGAYAILDRKSKTESVLEFQNLLGKYLGRMSSDTGLREYLNEQLDLSIQKKKIPSCFNEDMALNEDLLKFLLCINENCVEQMERVLSSRLYGNSKKFEHVIRPKALTILRASKKKETDEAEEDTELLEEYGVTRWPEIMEFSGNIDIIMDDGKCIDCNQQRYGSYINSDAVNHISEVKANKITHVLFIENKANYVWYVAKCKRENELVIYHGGVYSPSKGKWFQCIRNGVSSSTIVEHWSDIDVGGFRIFIRLKNTIFEQLMPYKMDIKTLEENFDKCLSLESDHYKSILKNMIEDNDYTVFHDVITYMLENNVKLEQENLIDD